MIFESSPPHYARGYATLPEELLIRGVMIRRLVAWLLDAALIAVIMSGLWTFFVFFGLLTLGLGWALFGVLPLVPVLYHWLSLCSPLSATPGQALMGLCVRRYDDLGPPGGLQALVFTVLFYVTLALGAIWMGIALFTPRHRTIHDMLSGLVVVRARGLTPTGHVLEQFGRIRSTRIRSPWGPQPSMSFKPPRRPQFFYTTAPLPCPYVAGRTERKVVTEITGPEAESLHDRLSRAGFRRSHNIAYAPVCPGCNSCVPIRIPVETFQPDRTLRRIAKANAALEAYDVPARATAEQFQLFQRYQQARHGDGDMATMSFYDYRAMVEDTPIETFVIEFRDPDERLVGACLTDRLGDGLSAVYSYFLPGLEKRSLGSYTILSLIDRARALELPYVYLGYWVPESRKMAYKSRFRPSEVLQGGGWRTLTDADLHDGPRLLDNAPEMVSQSVE